MPIYWIFIMVAVAVALFSDVIDKKVSANGKLKMKKSIIIILCALYMFGCGKEDEDMLHLGLNAKIVEIDSDKHIIYVSDMNGDIEKVFDGKCALDCSKAIERENIVYVNYKDVNDVRTIVFEDLMVGDEIILNIYDSELRKIGEGAVTVDAIVVEQIQLGTQRM